MVMPLIHVNTEGRGVTTGMSRVGFVCSLQQQHDGFCEWIQSKEQQSVGSEDARGLLSDLRDGR